MIPVVYNLLLLLVAPAAAVWFAWRDLRRGRVRQGWAERLGRLPAELVERCAGREVIWIHAVSVGETVAAKPLVAELRQVRPGAVILLSQITSSGRETALGAGADGVFYLPLDVPFAIHRVLDRLRPELLVTIDTEIWPNLFWCAHRRGVRLVVANGRLSDRSFGRITRYRLRWLYRWALRQADALLMQSELDAERAVALGAAADKVVVAGNLKADEPLSEVSAERLAWWRETLGLAPEAAVLLAGSTAPGEEEVLLSAWRRLRDAVPGLRLILVPRAIERAGEIERRVSAAGAACVRRSQLPERAADSLASQAVVIVDTIGELGELYAVATVAFVGRSLVPMGGSNVLQAAARGKPVLTGPHVHNVRDSVALLSRAGVCLTVRDEEELVARAAAWLVSPDEREAVGRRALEVMAANRGVTARTAARLVELLDG